MCAVIGSSCGAIKKFKFHMSVSALRMLIGDKLGRITTATTGVAMRRLGIMTIPQRSLRLGLRQRRGMEGEDKAAGLQDIGKYQKDQGMLSFYQMERDSLRKNMATYKRTLFGKQDLRKQGFFANAKQLFGRAASHEESSFPASFYSRDISRKIPPYNHNPLLASFLSTRANTSPFLWTSRRFYSSPTKEKLLTQTTNVFSRIMVHIKWTLHRGTRNFTYMDLLLAVISSMVIGNLLWLVLGTTSFGLGLMYVLHYLDNACDKVTGGSGTLSNLASAVLSNGLGVNLELLHNLPELIDGKLRFRNVHVSSRRAQGEPTELTRSKEPTSQSISSEFTEKFERSRGSSGSYDHYGDNDNTDYSDHHKEFEVFDHGEFVFAADVEVLDVSLSFNKWYEGHGLICDADVFGMHGVICKRDQETSDRRSKKIGSDFYQLEHVRIRDSFFEVYSDEAKTHAPLKVSIFGCEFAQLRSDRLLIDFFDANNVSGAVNDSMFTIHKRQDVPLGADKVIRFKINGINLGAISQANPQSKLNWLINGRADIVADITWPHVNSTEFDTRIGDVMSALIALLTLATEINTEEVHKSENQMKKENQLKKDQVHKVLESQMARNGDNQKVGNVEDSDTLLRGALAAIYHTFHKDERRDALSEYVVVDVRVKFSDLRASLPSSLPVASSTGAPFVTLPSLRSLIAFVNNYADAHSDGAEGTANFAYAHPLVVRTTVIEKLSQLHNITNLGETKLVDLIVSDVYEDMMRMARLSEEHLIHEKANLWSHSIASQLLLLGLGVIV